MNTNKLGKKRRNKALGYVYSSDGDLEHEDGRQLIVIEDYCSKRGWRPIIYSDSCSFEDETGQLQADDECRGEWNRLELYLDEPNVVALVVYDLRALPRSEGSVSELINFFHDHGLIVCFASVGLDTSTQEGREWAKQQERSDEYWLNAD